MFKNRKRYWAYFKFVMKHKYYVFISLFTFKPITKDLRKHWRLFIHLLYRVIIHDMSKLSFSEFFAYAKCFYNQDGSRRYKESREMDIAWLHHLNHNQHHYQYWIRNDDDGTEHRMDIPLVFVIEMILDWTAGGKNYDITSTAVEWYTAKKWDMILSNETEMFLDTWRDNPLVLPEYKY